MFMQPFLRSFFSLSLHIIKEKGGRDVRFRNKILRDTVLLTAMQLALDTASLFLSSFITRRLGASAAGLLSLTGSFLGLAGILANGSAFLCASRLISEELGRKNGDPRGVLRHGLCLCLCLSTAVSGGVVLLSGRLSPVFFGGADTGSAMLLMPGALITGAVGSCLKGYFNAVRKAALTAVGDTSEFLLRAGTMIALTLRSPEMGQAQICSVMMTAAVVGNAGSMLILGGAYLLGREGKSAGKCSLRFRDYARLAFPIMGGGVLQAFLSSANDALVPVCLRQYGDSVEEALGLFGIFEAIVIPTLFFPSVVLCSLSGIVVSETARASASGNMERVRSLADRLLTMTLIYAVIAAAVLMRSGPAIGELLGGGDTAGRMISAIAPVVPFIYLEIILEALIKGMGLQAFSAGNYLAEYVIRISVVLAAVPLLGFTGIAASYYASNIFGNIMRLRKILKVSGIRLSPVRRAVLPAVYAFLLMGAWELVFRSANVPECIASQAVFTFLWAGSYLLLYFFLGKFKIDSATISGNFVQNRQI